MAISREQFGSGRLGEQAYNLVASGANCKAPGCNNKADRTVDVDILGDAELFPACNGKHALEIERGACKQLSDQGINTVPSRNGFGRS
jgi:hypothetical protein